MTDGAFMAVIDVQSTEGWTLSWNPSVRCHVLRPQHFFHLTTSSHNFLIRRLVSTGSSSIAHPHVRHSCGIRSVVAVYVIGCRKIPFRGTVPSSIVAHAHVDVHVRWPSAHDVSSNSCFFAEDLHFRQSLAIFADTAWCVHPRLTKL